MQKTSSQNSSKIDSGIIFSAGLGTRFKPITDSIPKPLVELKNKALISYNIEVFENAKIQNIFANSFYLAEKLEDYISKNHPSVKIFREAERL
ncbi:MAG: sugar phosphate nucleotidyltransferase, partial [Rickettsiales bacterium]|nr:sugar phosphate nucleotidyltransferase [Rickettsiales bacterium]